MNAAHSPGTAWYDPGVHVPLGGLVTGVVVVVVVGIESLLKGTPSKAKDCYCSTFSKLDDTI